MIIFFNPYMIVFVLLFAILGTIGMLSNITSEIIVAMSIVLMLVNIVLCIRFVVLEKNSLIVGKIKKILLILFVIFFPIMTYVFVFISGKYLDYNNVNTFGKNVAVIYQQPKAYMASTIIGGVVNIVMIVVSYFAQYCEKGKKKIAIVLNCLVILMVFTMPYVSRNISYSNKIEYCKESSSKKCVIKKEDKLVAAFKMNYKKNTIDLSDPIVVGALNCSVKKGDVLYKTNNEYKKNGVKYIEVYNNNVWGYVSENNIK